MSISGGAAVTTTPTAGNITQNNSGSITDPVASSTSVSGAFTNLASLSGTVANPTTPASGNVLSFPWTPPPGPLDPTYPCRSGTYTINGNMTLSSGPTYFRTSSPSTNGNLVVSTGASAGRRQFHHADDERRRY